MSRDEIGSELRGGLRRLAPHLQHYVSVAVDSTRGVVSAHWIGGRGAMILEMDVDTAIAPSDRPPEIAARLVSAIWDRV